MELKKLMRIFFVVFLLSLVITIPLHIAAQKQPINQNTVTATIVNREPCHSFLHNVKGNYSIGRRSNKVHLTVRYLGREDTWCYENSTNSAGPRGFSNGTVQAYISPDGSLAYDEERARAHSTLAKLACTFLIITALSFMAFIIVYDKIWRIKHEQDNTSGKKGN